jgi:ABC-2 type transport system ATP-binding protein
MDTIAVVGLEKRYGDVQALAGVSFAVREGEVFGLLGPNGAGKSTTVRILCTLTTPDAGRAEVAGHDVLRSPGSVRRSIGYVPQESGVDRCATGRENLVLQGRIQGLRGAQLHRRVDELLELLGIADAADRVVRGYSGGMKRRLDVALGLVHSPQVLFLDEPTTGLDPEARVVEGTPDDLKRKLRGEAVTVELVDGAGRDAVSVARAIEGVHEATLEGRSLRTRVESGARAIPGILSALEAAGISVESVTSHRPSLDDVYLHYTGREFAADEQEAAA